jgi:hypothetical protein
MSRFRLQASVMFIALRAVAMAFSFASVLIRLAVDASGAP